MKICSTCEDTYSPSSRHNVCPRCRSKRRNESVDNRCIDCNASISYKAKRCQPCGGLARVGPTKGGIKHNKGYALVYLPEHPRAQKQYVLEHIIVMENILGRSLVPGENVHHKNGVRDDNRDSNLELWIVNQPSGQRPSDLVEWAKEILNLYGDIV